MTPDLRTAIGRAGYDWAVDEQHVAITRRLASLSSGNDAAGRDLVVSAAAIRRFLG
jgi:hypothetical protein